MMKKILCILSCALGLLISSNSCQDHLVVLFDTPFFAITDIDGTLSEMDINKDANGLVSELKVRFVVSNHYYQEPVTLNYDLICGDGITEGVDFAVQPSTASPLTFNPADGYERIIRIVFYKNPAFDASKDNTLRVRLSGSSLKNAIMGYPGPDHLKSEFIFTKK
ncbi:MAG: hypothetical protein IJS07_06335 [Bacteroidales bacterium]|nr:hypothetical protein [Bacteroidales bacterium]